jgi:hypothetical protein
MAHAVYMHMNLKTYDISFITLLMEPVSIPKN